MLLIGGVYGFWRNASGNIEGTWKLKRQKSWMKILES